MLKPVRRGTVKPSGARVAIVAAQYNARYVDSLVEHARATLASASVPDPLIVRVPGSFEIPVVAARLAREKAPAWSAIICFGVILRGQTTHAQHIAEAVSHALASLQIQGGVPIIHGVLLFENEAQAKVRCLGKEHNRGIEAAQVALEMAAVMQSLP